MKRGSEAWICHDGKWSRKVPGYVVTTRKKAFLCLYEGNRFFDSAASALDWIDTEHSKDRNKWRVVEITAEPITQQLSDA